MSEITLITRDGAKLGLAASPTETVLEAAEAAGLFLPAMCHEGSCGLCSAQVMQGDYTLRGGPREPAADGAIPLCLCMPQSALTIALPYPQSGISHHSVPTRTAAIASITPAGSGALALTLTLQPDPELGTAADFTPGQYMEVSIPGMEIKRAYSLTNLPNWDGTLEFLIRLQPGGAFSTWLAQSAKPGDTLSLRGPVGRFVLDETSPRPRILVGGGCGFAPLLSMLRHLADFQDTQPTHLIFGANTESELGVAAPLEALAAQLPNLTICCAVWHPQPGWSGFTGTAADALAQHLDSAAGQPDIYLCGPPRLMQAVTQVANDRGIPPARIYSEQVQAR
jgi:ferredoxin-NADP reductase/ferredoxin